MDDSLKDINMVVDFVIDTYDAARAITANKDEAKAVTKRHVLLTVIKDLSKGEDLNNGYAQ